MILQADIYDIVRHHGWKRFLLAVSGGLDSICLAHYFIANRDVLGIEWLGIAHVNHGLRAGSADLDEKLVRDFAAANGIPFFCAHLEGAALKSAEGSLEENARDARYDALRHFAEEALADAILTAHHAGDQAETVYMRLRRGTTLEGLKGMQDVSSFIYRPFLSVAREELRNYARENNLDWREDESNSDTKFARNKIRHELLPTLENRNPGTSEQLTRIAALADKAYHKICATANTFFSPALVPTTTTDNPSASIPAGLPQKHIALDKKKFRKILEKHASADISETFRLWLSAQGFRFPVDFFKSQREPANTRIPHPVAYRKRSIVKTGRTVWICEFEDAGAAAKFVSCE